MLERQDGARLEAQVGPVVLRQLPHEALEGHLAQEQLRRLLILADLPKGDGAGAVAVLLQGLKRLLARHIGQNLPLRLSGSKGLPWRSPADVLLARVLAECHPFGKSARRLFLSTPE